ncbi:hypothetical protein BO78DRAFT_312984 [Aspergillus sclerotiicarbonarius CBS 121057]|uniref:Uncharacterized protein n=1 Tax=Aspergillus sclerotiicarbonarius (strain CBS 121057 / IBT 28362) TaxID=1448318 RepID=A0A319EBJ6_ASPSB|nr:hypothetical protein BO78DRAFT_312984 [Aspergillus sclerotiicarbonarius CBS 121057]
MAHQAHNICWNILANNLVHRSPAYPDADLVSNLYFRFKPTQGKEIGYFAESFARNIAEHTKCERQKYPANFDPIQPDEVLLDDRTAEKVRPMAYKWCKAYQKWDWPLAERVQKTPGLCPHRDNDGFFACGCPFPFSERKGSAFLRRYQSNHCYEFFNVNIEAFYNLQVVNALLVLGEMEPVLRLCNSGNDLAQWMEMNECYCMKPDRGWDQVFKAALHIYLALNILFCFPELWDPASRQARNKKKSEEYRATLMYQKAVRTWTQEGSNNDVPRYPHRQFFGLEDHFHQSDKVERYRKEPAFLALLAEREAWRCGPGEFCSPPVRLDNDNFPFGKVRFEVFLNCTKVASFQPNTADIERIEGYLRMKGLPQELVLQITALADYDFQRTRRLPVPHDPLHRGNRRELRQYLTLCWQIMVRCNMLAQELGTEINWVSEVVHALHDLVSTPPGKTLFKCEWHESYDYMQATMRGGSGEFPYAFRD